MQEYTVESSTVFRQGTGAKGAWTLYKINLVDDSRHPTGFDIVQPGDRVTITESQNGQYTNLNYKKSDTPAPVQSAAPAASGSGAYGPRVLKMLVVIAEQIGIDKQKTLEVLGG